MHSSAVVKVTEAVQSSQVRDAVFADMFALTHIQVQQTCEHSQVCDTHIEAAAQPDMVQTWQFSQHARHSATQDVLVWKPGQRGQRRQFAC
jgi:hypothetical protein